MGGYFQKFRRNSQSWNAQLGGWVTVWQWAQGKMLPHARSLVPPRSGASRAEPTDLCNQSLPEKYPLTGEGVFFVTQASLRGSGILNLGISVLRCGYGNSVWERQKSVVLFPLVPNNPLSLTVVINFMSDSWLIWLLHLMVKPHTQGFHRALEKLFPWKQIWLSSRQQHYYSLLLNVSQFHMKDHLHI